MSDNQSRRPLKIRGNIWSKSIASYLSKQSITPNQISIFSIFFAILSSICIVLIFSNIWLYSILAALFIQMRLLCNLFDGMVALEGGKSTKSGELYNDIPDRVSDSILFIALGYFTSYIEIGYLAALFAMMTAYIRVLGSSMGAGAVFKGPMAKQHRMALLTIALILTPLESIFMGQNYIILSISLFIITIGSFFTVLNRTYTIYKILEDGNDV
ncbi:CDP-alcohol phosphatidyltransferase family protein [Arcobacter sp.]|uniref:CDP-alcohol phosphatidyltransferase family protein n=1 Tax=Arcobacter sp. TaxID=1872629 RepID=UPI003C761125